MNRKKPENEKVVRRENAGLGEKPGGIDIPGNEKGPSPDGDLHREVPKRRDRPAGICVCPSCGRTEAQVPLTPCHDMMCPRCRIPMREM